MDQPNDSPPEREFSSGRLAGGNVLGGPDHLDRRLAMWASDLAVDEAARARARTRWLELQQSESATVVGTLIALGERGGPVSVACAGLRVRGRIAGVGSDFVAMSTDQGQDVLVSIDGIEEIHAQPGRAPVTSDRSDVLAMSLSGVLDMLTSERVTVVVRTRSGAMSRGVLRGCGADVVQLQASGDPAAVVWIPLVSVTSITLTD